MSVEQNKEIVRQWVKDVDEGRGSLDFIDRWMTPDFKSYPPGASEPLDVAGYRQMAGTYLAAFPEMRHEIHQILAEGEWVAFAATLHLVHSGDFMGAAPTGRKIKIEEFVVVRIRDGKIAEERFVLDSAALYQQLAVVLTPAQAASSSTSVQPGT